MDFRGSSTCSYREGPTHRASHLVTQLTAFIIRQARASRGDEHAAFDAALAAGELEPSFDGITLLQQYVEPPSGTITRVEIVDGSFLYALQASTAGGFELCPSDACQVSDAFCPVGASGKFGASTLTANDEIVRKYVQFCRDHQIDAAGIEFVTGQDGRRYTYDINMNTNYNSDVEALTGVQGMDAWGALCARLLEEQGEERLSA